MFIINYYIEALPSTPNSLNDDCVISFIKSESFWRHLDFVHDVFHSTYGVVICLFKYKHKLYL